MCLPFGKARDAVIVIETMMNMTSAVIETQDLPEATDTAPSLEGDMGPVTMIRITLKTHLSRTIEIGHTEDADQTTEIIDIIEDNSTRMSLTREIYHTEDADLTMIEMEDSIENITKMNIMTRKIDRSESAGLAMMIGTKIKTVDVSKDIAKMMTREIGPTDDLN